MLTCVDISARVYNATQKEPSELSGYTSWLMVWFWALWEEAIPRMGPGQQGQLGTTLGPMRLQLLDGFTFTFAILKVLTVDPDGIEMKKHGYQIWPNLWSGTGRKREAI